MFVNDIIERNGLTILENNLNIPHKYSVGEMVWVDVEDYHGLSGKIKLCVVSQGRDCNGEPLYTLSKEPILMPTQDGEFPLWAIFVGFYLSCYGESSLSPTGDYVEVTTFYKYYKLIFG